MTGDAPSSSHPSRHTQEEGEEGDEDELETYLLLLLSDSNLPTGGFVASSGLESFHAHGLLHNARPTSDLAKYGSTSRAAAAPRTGPSTAPSQAHLSSATLSFARSTLHSYARSSFGFLARVHAIVTRYLDAGVDAKHGSNEAAQKVCGNEHEQRLKECLDMVAQLDYSYHTLLLNHVARRASKAQGIALLTLYSKAFAKPINLSREAYNPTFSSCRPSHTDTTSTTRIELAASLVDRLKLDIRRAATRSCTPSSGMQGHLPICWAVFAACLGLSLKKAVFLHLFLQARSLFSSSIRLNTLGPYLAHQVMRFQMRPVVEGILREMEREGCLRINMDVRKHGSEVGSEDQKSEEEQMQIDNALETDTVQAYTIAEHPASTPEKAKPFRNTATMISASPVTAPRPKVQALRIGKGQLIRVDDDDPNQGWAWDWPEEQDICIPSQSRSKADTASGGLAMGHDSQKGFWTQSCAPATTFPLGEIIQARHDQLHSRLFNS